MDILITEASEYSQEAISIYKKFGNVRTDYKSGKSYNDVSVLVVRLSLVIDSYFVKRFPKLKFIITPTTGQDHIQHNNKNIKLISLKNEIDFLNTITPTSELAWALIQNLNRKIIPAFIDVKNGSWERDKFVSSSLSGKTIGIIGYGRLGKQIEKYAKAFGMKVKKYDRLENRSDCELEELLEESDVINLTVDLNESSRNLINLNHLKRMKKTAIIVNTSRAEILNEEDLLYALENKLIAGAGLDVLLSEIQNENKSGNLIKYMKNNNNLIITPHIGGACYQSMRKTELFCAKKFEEIMNENHY